MINTQWLRTFCYLVEERHFTRTAQRLHMTQSGVTQHVQKLEEQLGAALLVREGKRFSLTAEGERLYEEGKGLVYALSALGQSIRHDPSHEGLVRIMSPGSLGLMLYPQLLDFQSKYPKIVLDYRFGPNQSIESAIANHKCDIGLMTHMPTSDDVRFEPIATEPLLLVTPASVKTVDWPTLQGLGCIHHPDSHHYMSQLLRANFSEFIHVSDLPTTGFSNQISLILEPVARGLGFTVLPEYAVRSFSAPQQLSVHTLSHSVKDTIYLCHHGKKTLKSLYETMAGVIGSLLN